MKFSLALTPYWRFSDHHDVLKTAALADRLGFYAVNFGDHIAIPLSHKGAIDTIYYDPFVMAMAITARCPRIRVYFNVLVIPYRQPVPMAKAIATLDVLSGGRIIIGAGLGFLEPEFQSVGAPLKARAPMTEEYLRAMKALWAGGPTTFQGRYVSFKDMISEPLPVQKPHPPIWIALNRAKQGMVRAAELGDGAAVLNRPMEDLKRDLDELRRLLVQRGRNPRDFSVQFSLYYGRVLEEHRAHFRVGNAQIYDVLSADPGEALRQIEGYAALGITHLSLRHSARGYEEFERQLLPFHEQVLQPLSKMKPG